VVSTWGSSVSSARAPPRLSFRTLWVARMHAAPGQAPCLAHRYSARCAHTGRPRQSLFCRQAFAHRGRQWCDPARAHSLPPPDVTGGSASCSRWQARAGALGHRKPQHPTREREAAPPAAPGARVHLQKAPAAADASSPKTSGGRAPRAWGHMSKGVRPGVHLRWTSPARPRAGARPASASRATGQRQHRPAASWGRQAHVSHPGDALQFPSVLHPRAVALRDLELVHEPAAVGGDARALHVQAELCKVLHHLPGRKACVGSARSPAPTPTGPLGSASDARPHLHERAGAVGAEDGHSRGIAPAGDLNRRGLHPQLQRLVLQQRAAGGHSRPGGPRLLLECIVLREAEAGAPLHVRQQQQAHGAWLRPCTAGWSGGRLNIALEVCFTTGQSGPSTVGQTFGRGSPSPIRKVRLVRLQRTLHQVINGPRSSRKRAIRPAAPPALAQPRPP